MNILHSQKGEAVAGVIIWAFLILFIIFPVSSVVLEKYIIIIKAQEIKDSIDITNIAVYNTIDAGNTGKGSMSFNWVAAIGIYNELLSQNLRLNSDLSPTINSIPEAQVSILSLELYTSGFPLTCPNNKQITRPTVHACVRIPIKPSLYRQVILEIMGRQYIDVDVHVDTELPDNR